MLSGDKRLSFHPDADASRIVSYSSKVPASGRGKRKSRKPRSRRPGVTGFDISMDRIWEMCTILYEEERTIHSVATELGLNYEAAKKVLQRFRRACQGIGIELVTFSYPENVKDETFMVKTPKWRDKCHRFLMMISKDKSKKP